MAGSHIRRLGGGPFAAALALSVRSVRRSLLRNSVATGAGVGDAGPGSLRSTRPELPRRNRTPG